MRNSPDFESDDSFEGVDPPEEDGGWGVVSHTSGSNGGVVTTSGRSEDYGYGVLILDGVESEASQGRRRSSRRDPLSDLSLPGTDSLPSEIGSISAAVPTDVIPDDHEEDEDYSQDSRPYQSGDENPLGGSWSDEGASLSSRTFTSWRRRLGFRHKRNLALGCLCCLLVLVAGLLVQQHRTYRLSVHRLEMEILRLQYEKEEQAAKAAAAAAQANTRALPPPWMEEGEPSDDAFTIVDNCWVSAKMDLKWGECGRNARELPSILWGKAAGFLGDFFGSLKKPLRSESTCKKDQARHEPASWGGNLQDLGATIGGELIEEKAREGLIVASQNVKGALVSAGAILVREVEELQEDPLKYASAMITATSSQKGDDVWEATQRLSEASQTWKEAMQKTGISVSQKLTEILEDPVSYYANAKNGGNKPPSGVSP